MLQFMRQAAGSWVVKILFILLILSFGAWGVTGVYNQSGRDNTVAEVGRVKIGANQLDQEFRRQINRMRQVFGPQFDAEQAKQFGLVNQSLRQLIDRTVYDLAARDLGLVVSDRLVLQEIQREPAFRNQQGQFEPERFRSVLATNGLTEQGYADLVKRELARGELLGALGAGVQAPAPIVDDLYRRQAEKRVAETLTVPNASITDIPTPDDQTLKAYQADKADRFSAPEYRALTVLSLSVEDLARGITVSDQDLQDAYRDRADEFRTPARRDFEQVVVDDEAKAKAIADAAKGGKSLADAAKENGTDVLPLPKTAESDLPPDLARAAFAQPIGKVGDPVHTELGWHVMLATAEEPATERSFDAVKDELRQQLQREKAADEISTVANKLDDTLAGGASVEEAAQKLNLPVVKIPETDAKGRKADGGAVTGIPALPQVLQTAFGLQQGGVSQLTQTPDGGYFLVRADGITPAALRPFDSVRDQVLAAWQADQRSERAAHKAEELAKEIREGKPIAEVAAANGLTVATSPAVTRDAHDAGGLPPDLVGRLFEMKVGDVATGAGADGHVVARLKEVQPADPAAAKTETAATRDALEQQMTSDLLAQFGDAMRRRYDVKIHQSTVDGLYASPQS